MIENLNVRLTTEFADAAFMLTFDSEFESDRDMQTILRRDGACEPDVVHLMTRVIKPGDVVVDGGANVGFFTCFMSQLVGKSGLVFAVEPSPVNIRKLEHNLANNTMKNVRVVKSPLYAVIKEHTLYMSQHSGFNSLEPCPQTVGRLKTVSTTIDAMLDGQWPKLMKLDIEGAEGKALIGAKETLRHCPYIVMEMNQEALQRFGCSRETIREYMAAFGFDMFLLHSDGTLPRLIPRKTGLVSKMANLMALFATVENVAVAWPTVEIESH